MKLRLVLGGAMGICVAIACSTDYTGGETTTAATDASPGVDASPEPSVDGSTAPTPSDADAPGHVFLSEAVTWPLVLGDDEIFYPRAGAEVVRVSKAGGAPTIAFTVSTGDTLADIATDGTYLAITVTNASTTRVLACPATGCSSAPTVLDTQSYVGPVQVHAGNVYWVTGKQIRSCPATGCVQPTLLVDDAGIIPSVLRVEPSGVYMLASQVKRAELDGGGLATILTKPTASLAMELDTTDVFVANGVRAFRCAKTGCGDAAVVTPATAFAVFAVDDARVYMANRWDPEVTPPSGIATCAVGGCNALDALDAGDSPYGPIAVDATRVYLWRPFADAGGVTLEWVAK